MRKIVLSEKDLVAAKAILREAYENGGLRAARDAAKALVGVDGYVSVMVAAFQGEVSVSTPSRSPHFNVWMEVQWKSQPNKFSIAGRTTTTRATTTLQSNAGDIPH
jgi:hypothetical protein